MGTETTFVFAQLCFPVPRFSSLHTLYDATAIAILSTLLVPQPKWREAHKKVEGEGVNLKGGGIMYSHWGGYN